MGQGRGIFYVFQACPSPPLPHHASVTLGPYLTSTAWCDTGNFSIAILDSTRVQFFCYIRKTENHLQWVCVALSGTSERKYKMQVRCFSLTLNNPKPGRSAKCNEKSAWYSKYRRAKLVVLHTVTIKREYEGVSRLERWVSVSKQIPY